jgi:citrate lyase subunit beta / citryl-CoA lyase
MTTLRSLLLVPGNHPRHVEKAISLAADGVILEDAVAASDKLATSPRAALTLTAPRHGKLFIRVNGLTTEWCYGDLTAVVRTGLDSIILPKVEQPDNLHIVDWVISILKRKHGLPVGSIDLIPIIETAVGVRNLGSICRFHTRIRRIAFGADDFNLGMGWTRSDAELLPYRSACVLELPVDTVWADLRDLEGFLASARHAAQLGFQGKICAHPDQIASAAFSPDEATIATATGIVEAFDEAERKGIASIQLDGQFIDYPLVACARRILDQGAGRC